MCLLTFSFTAATFDFQSSSSVLGLLSYLACDGRGRLSICSFWKTSDTCEPHHYVTSEYLATHIGGARGHLATLRTPLTRC